MLDSSSRKAGGVGVLMKAVGGGGGKKYKHFQEGRDVTHKSKRKKGKSPSTTKINDPFLAVILFSLSFIYTHIVVSVLHITLYLAPLKSSFFDLREAASEARGAENLSRRKKVEMWSKASAQNRSKNYFYTLLFH